MSPQPIDESSDNATHRDWAEMSASIESRRPLGATQSGEAQQLILTDGSRWMVKSAHDPDAASMLEAEADGLRSLAAVGVLRVPEHRLHRSEENGRTVTRLSLEWVDAVGGDDRAWRAAGTLLARHHRRGKGESYGHHRPNYLGANRQDNTRCSDWAEFWTRSRLDPQIKWADRAGHLDDQTRDLLARARDHSRQILADEREPPTLLHGDLWNGNLLFSGSEAVFIDPAVYHGNREAELAMCALFGGFPESFWRSYADEWPLSPGWRDRSSLYQLYHLLNHLNLFGAGYLERSRTAARAILRLPA